MAYERTQYGLRVHYVASRQHWRRSLIVNGCGRGSMDHCFTHVLYSYYVCFWHVLYVPLLLFCFRRHGNTKTTHCSGVTAVLHQMKCGSAVIANELQDWLEIWQRSFPITGTLNTVNRFTTHRAFYVELAQT